MSKRVDFIINELKEEVNRRKTIIKRNEDHIKELSNECTEILEIIKKLEDKNAHN